MTYIESSQPTPGRNAWLGESHGYRIAGDWACLNAELALSDQSETLAQQWALQLWACDQPYQGGALAGITRETIISLAGEAGIPVIERRITRDEFYIADEAFFTGTAAEVTPIREFDHRPIGEGRRGPVTAKLQTMFFDVVNGRSAKHREWLTPVS